jgi:glycosyltransferase involved in cell wall biosynthesis
MKKISVIIPVYNGEKYLSEAVYSVKKQTYPIHEIIIINDGSTDNTQKIIENLRKEISNIIPLFQENSGPARARNYGILKSSGDYIAFCDADDIWLPRKIEKQIGLFETETVGLVFSGVSFVGHKKGGFWVKNKNSLKSLFWNNYIPNSTVIIPKFVVKKVGLLNESRDFFAVEDYEYWLRISLFFGIKSVPELLVKYRAHESQISKWSSDSYKRLSLIYKRFLLDIRYYRYWHICLFKYVENTLKFYFVSLWKTNLK